MCCLPAAQRYVGNLQVPGIWGDLKIELNADLFSEDSAPVDAVLNFCTWVIDRCKGVCVTRRPLLWRPSCGAGGLSAARAACYEQCSALQATSCNPGLPCHVCSA